MNAAFALIRPAHAADVPFILDSWLNSFRHAYHTRGMDGPVYFQEQRRVVETLLRRCSVLVACDSGEPSSVWGYAVGEEIDSYLVVHFVYVRAGFQDHGIGTDLMKAFLAASPHTVALVYTHQTKAGRRWAEKMAPRAPERNGAPVPVVYNPYLMYRTLGAGWSAP